MPLILREPKATKTCPTCGIVYEVTLIGLLNEDCETFDCCLCGERLDDWESTIILDYRVPEDAEKTPRPETAVLSGASALVR